MPDSHKLEIPLGYQFKNPALLRRATTHRSAGGDHNERLEFLGDAILGFVIAGSLYEKFPTATEGDLSRLRAAFVNREALADIAHRLNLGASLHFGAGERKSGGKRRASILADGVEALFGAVYLDGGLDAVRRVILAIYEKDLARINLVGEQKDSKTRLQELMQSRGLPLPDYTVAEIRGEAHNQTFNVNCRVSLLDTEIEGVGKTKKLAEQAAAAKALEALGDS
ncbi:MAG: ribonuclease III [Pseudohongiellaceae bacterium]